MADTKKKPLQMEDLTPEKLLRKNPVTGAWEHNPEAMQAAGAALAALSKEMKAPGPQE